MAEGTSFRGLNDPRITALPEDFCRSGEGLAHQVLEVDIKVKELGIKLDKMDVKFEELKHLIMGFQDQESIAVKLDSDATTKAKTGLRSTCMEEVHNRCPTCRQELGDIRCLAQENVAESLELPCKYYTLGCPEIFPYDSKLKHEEGCSFKPYSCPYAGSECAVIGNIPFLVSHLRDDHQVDMHSGCTFNHRYLQSNPREVKNATWMLTVFHCFGQYFCLHFEAFQLGSCPVYIAFLRFMGDEADARNYSYSLEVGENDRKVIWEGTPHTIRDSHQIVRDSHDGLIIQRNMALFFSGGEKKELKLKVTGKIWKEEQKTKAEVCTPNLCD
ncbi:E3 ubiquitin-protein ligase SINAT5-like [Apium graveolens]|uniref:E3 ubiquitin-protein ligase SINAT5-like n=1 Tax=Apium graveolens TaxID=4045 RepID=UPI003D78E463